MVHTVEITSQLNKTEYNNLYKHPNTRRFPDKYGNDKTENTLLSEYGISHVYIQKEKIADSHYAEEWKNYSYWCKAELNLQRVANGGIRTRELFKDNDQEQLDRLYENFSKCMEKLLPSKAHFSDWNTTRIDYAFDIKTPFVREYIKLFQKGDKPHGTVIPARKQHKRADKRTHYSDSVRYQDGSKTINFYDKHEERIQEQLRRKITDEQELEESRDVLRIEVQCKRNKTNALKHKNQMHSKELCHFLGIPDARDIILKSFKKVCGIGDYYTYEMAEKLIRSSAKQQKTKEEMCEFLSLINGNRGTRSVWKARNKYDGNFDSIVKHFSDLKINMVTIPNSREIIKGKVIDKEDLPLPSLYQELLNSLGNE